ncbi:MAG TPA: thioredoxin domain-containing protein [Methanoregula sp.]|nr:thioredoxin domain-containing protein [Methanoregula sp.]
MQNREPGSPVKKGNRLSREKSPYLLQHAENPVDWYPWGEEAFSRAAREDKPVFLSIGYATCHWCHVMAHESFEDEEVAELLNRDFVAIKVDREERPDIDSTYMHACQMLSGQGGVAADNRYDTGKKAVLCCNLSPEGAAVFRSGAP